MIEMIPWTAEYPLELDRALRVRLGPLELRVSRRARELRVSSLSDPNQLARAPEVDHVSPEDEPGGASPKLNTWRFGFTEEPSRLRLAPALADRPVIIRPEEPLTLLPGEEVRAYVSSPVWLRLLVGEARRLLLELPSHRPSDTWFGPLDHQGQLCYALATHLSLTWADRLWKPHRAITPVVIVNSAQEPFTVARLRVPVGQLSIYGTPDRRLWTERITLTRRDDAEGEARVTVDGEPPREAEGGELLSPPRAPGGRSFNLRAFEGALFGRSIA
ncbi:MAG: hypothetical protein IPN01_17385 [Deltaproteobacteria bacterium]|nr:hypothetical protein [Deltaproteobacteria bacterium]